jgi:hypothetical protein
LVLWFPDLYDIAEQLKTVERDVGEEPFGSNGWKLGLVPFATVPVVKVIGGRNSAAAD